MFSAGTWHSIAHAPMARIYGREKLGGTLRTREIMDIMNVEWAVTAIHINAALNRFLISADDELKEIHVGNDVGEDSSGDSAYSKKVLGLTCRLWAKTCDKTSKVPLTHDGYLKLFLTSGAKLDGIDAILADEFQDTNPVVANFVLRQPNEGKSVVLVGDRTSLFMDFVGQGT